MSQEEAWLSILTRTKPFSRIIRRWGIPYGLLFSTWLGQSATHFLVPPPPPNDPKLAWKETAWQGSKGSKTLNPDLRVKMPAPHKYQEKTSGSHCRCNETKQCISCQWSVQGAVLEESCVTAFLNNLSFYWKQCYVCDNYDSIALHCPRRPTSQPIFKLI